MLTEKKRDKQETIISIRNTLIGGTNFFIAAGPCSIESEEQIMLCAQAASMCGAQGLRGGAFKSRTSPYAFQGIGEIGLKLMRKAADAYDLLVISEIMDTAQIPLLLSYVDILQVGSRNMHNFSLLKELGKIDRPVLLKRGFAATYQELLFSAEYILQGGNRDVILCERGIRTFETYTRNTLDLNAIPALKELTHLPIIVDPSHGTGKRSLVPALSKASLAVGAHGLIIEIHPNPDKALSDGAQTIDFKIFEELMQNLRALQEVLL